MTFTDRLHRGEGLLCGRMEGWGLVAFDASADMTTPKSAGIAQVLAVGEGSLPMTRQGFTPGVQAEPPPPPWTPEVIWYFPWVRRPILALPTMYF